MLEIPLQKAIKTTAAHLKRLKELGIETVSDFLSYYPRRYTDASEVKPLCEVTIGELNTVRVKIKSIHARTGFRGRGAVIRAILEDASGSMEAVWFNQQYLAKKLFVGMEIMASGKVRMHPKQGRAHGASAQAERESGSASSSEGRAYINKAHGASEVRAYKSRPVFQSPTVEFINTEQIHTARIVPVYHETTIEGRRAHGASAQAERESGSASSSEGQAYKNRTGRRGPGKISSKWIREKLFPLMKFADGFSEFLPAEIRKEYRLLPYAEAIRAVHFPKNEMQLDRGKRRLAFDELFLLQLAALYRRSQYRKTAKEAEKAIPADWELMKKFSQSLPWPLTNAQKKAIYEIIKDLEKPYPMTRLLEGDVGSGKTVVAAAAILHIIKAGFQTCLLAPTEILARQHVQTLSKVLQPFGIAPALLVGSLMEKEKREITDSLKQGKIPLVVGTHAVLQEKVGFKNLALAVIDEQHRFGVRQREALRAFGSPHMLHLSATPIPRTLALILYGDQDLSILDEMPPGRKPVKTHVVPEEKRNNAYEWIAREIKKGRQAFIIFPLIEESEILQIKAATQEFKRLSNEIFPEFRLGLLHGKMPSEEKKHAMEDFSKGKIQILVSTAVVEVGVDIPNATIMMIEGAERFGLAQLHQFRGRVGRGSEASYCFLFPTNFVSSASLVLAKPDTRSPRARAVRSQQGRNLLEMKRLQALVRYQSGFKLAEIDLQLRGPGEVYGTAQSGIPDLKMAVLSDAITIKQSREAAEKILEIDPELANYSNLKEKIAEQENVAVDI